MNSREISNKLRRFVDCYHDDIECFDAVTKGIIFPNKDIFKQRYITVFRESPDLDAMIPRRFFLTSWDGNENTISLTNDAFFIDCETFRNLVKPIGGAFDGSTGLSDNIPEADIVVMYHVVPTESAENDEKFVIRRAWFFNQDEEGLAKRMVVSCDLSGSDTNESHGSNIQNMKSIPAAEINASKALTVFFNIAKEQIGSHKNLNVYELSSDFLQETYHPTYD
jgi:hypothetical protein